MDFKATMTLVFNASPLIVLAKSGLINHLLPLADGYWIPQAVADEVRNINDLAARRCAQAVGVQITGTLGLILLAKRRGLIPSVSPALDAVVAAGLFVTNHHLDAIRIAAGE